MLENDILSDSQHGFVLGRNCVTQLLQVMDQWTKIIDEGGEIDAIYLDFAKAFDKVPHQRLLMKLKQYGIEDKVLKWCTSFLTSRRQRVCIRGCASAWLDVISGVPQGSVLGPILFVFYINDLPEGIRSMVFMYADDTKIARKVGAVEDRLELQKDLENLWHWAEKWQMRFNTDKCKVLHIKRTGDKAEYNMADRGSSMVLEESKLERDIGVWMDSDLKFSGHVAKVVSTANQLLGMIKRAFVYKDGPTVKLLFMSLIRPHLEYANVVWHPFLKKDIQQLESVQRRATKLVTEMKGMTYQERLKGLQLPSLMYRRYRGHAIEVYKYLNGYYKIGGEGIFKLVTEQRTRGHTYKLIKQGCHTRLRQNFFGLRAVNIWNRLPETVVMAPSLNAFQLKDHQWSNLQC